MVAGDAEVNQMLAPPLLSSRIGFSSGSRAGGPGRNSLAVIYLTVLWLAVQMGPLRASGQDLLGEPARASAETPDELSVESQSLEAHTVSNQNPDARAVGSRRLPSGFESEPGSPPAQSGISPDGLTVQADPLSDLPDASEVERQVDQQTWQQLQTSRPAPARPKTLEDAHSNLTRARARLQAAKAAVGKMIRRDYPTGPPRVRIYDEQRLARRQVRQAEAWIREFGGSPD